MVEDKKYTLRELRKTLGLTMQQTAEALGMAYYYYRNRERYEVECSVSDAISILALYGVGINHIEWQRPQEEK